MRICPIPAIAALLGVALVVLAAPRLTAGLVTAPFDDTVRALGRGEPLSDEALRLALGSRIRATGWVGDGQYFADAAALQFAVYENGPQTRGRLDTVIDAHRVALERAPSQTFLWYRLALASLLRDGYGPAVGDALRMSLETGRHEARLVMPRLALALSVWAGLPADVRSGFDGQIALAMRWYARELVTVTQRSYRLATVRAALEPYSGLRDSFNLLYERRRGLR